MSAQVASVRDHQGSLKHIRIHSSYPAESIALGASIACSGPCLTVTAMGPRDGGGSWFEVDAGAETLARTTVALGAPGTLLNLERPLKIGDELGGHIVSGHVDGVAEIVARDDVTGDDAMGRHGALHRPCSRATGQVHRRKRLGCSRWDIPDGQFRGPGSLHRIPDSAHARGDDLGRDAGRRASTSRSTRWPATPRALRKRVSKATDGASSRTISVPKVPMAAPRPPRDV